MNDQPTDHPAPSSIPGRPLDPILSPRSIAVVGASRGRKSLGYAVLHNLVTHEFDGAIYPVNPKARVVHSLRCYPSVTAIPDSVDLAIVLVPRDHVLPVVANCAAAGIRGLVVITAGFRETGPEGAALEAKLRSLVRKARIRMIGPNCMGVLNADPDVSMVATFAPTPAHSGSIGFISQSGALGVAILNMAESLGIGFTQFVSVGNKIDVSGNDLLEHWEHDEATRVIAMYLESFGNPRRFTQIAKRISRRKPILVVKSGRTAEGALAASSHTGALAGADVTISAFLDQCGVIRANTVEELFDVAQVLDRCPIPTGDRVAVVTNAGGPGIMATDALVGRGLRMARLAPTTRDALRTFLPPEASTANPVDMIASATGLSYRRALDAVLADAGVDMVMAIHVTPMPTDPNSILDEIMAGTRTDPSKPVISVMMAAEEFYDHIQWRSDLVPVFRFPESAALALDRIYRYGVWRRRPLEDAAPTFEVDDARVTRLLETTGSGYLPPEAVFEILEAYGIPTAPWGIASDAGEAGRIAGRIGFPVVVKAVASAMVHKSDVGGVAVDIRTSDELEAACDSIRFRVEKAGHPLEGFLVQKLGRGGHEVIFGLSFDPRFGPLLMFGIGGKYVEVLRDVRFGVTPITRTEAREMIRGIRGIRLLEGVRGDKPADLDLLEEIVLRLAQLVERHPSIIELDINPFLAAADRGAAMALDGRIRVGDPSVGRPSPGDNHPNPNPGASDENHH